MFRVVINANMSPDSWCDPFSSFVELTYLLSTTKGDSFTRGHFGATFPAHAVDAYFVIPIMLLVANLLVFETNVLVLKKDETSFGQLVLNPSGVPISKSLHAKSHIFLTTALAAYLKTPNGSTMKHFT